MLDTSSGYTDDISGEINSVAPIPVDKKFSDIRECYVSETGHTRLFRATRYGKLFILKCLKSDFLYTPVYRQALRKEFEIGMLLDHPNICRTIGMEEVDDLGTAIIIEYVDGETLANLINEKKLSANMARKVAQQLADALGYMHGKQIMHRDLKPSNIIVTHNGHNVKLIDFGLSDSDEFNVLKTPAGTSGYIAPELLLPCAKSDVRADIYSLGMVIKDMAQATDDKQLMKIAEACTQHNPDKRPSGVAQIFTSTHPGRKRNIILIVLSVIVALLIAYIAASLLTSQQTPTSAQ